MYEIASMAGYLAAHGVLCVSDGATLIPILGYEQADGQRVMERLMYDDIADGARAGQEALASGRDGWVRAVLVTDAYLHLETGRVDALVVNAVEYGPVKRSVRLAIPYRPQSEGFAVYRPKFLDAAGIEESDYDELMNAFYAGVDSHEEAVTVWNAHLLDESA